MSTEVKKRKNYCYVIMNSRGKPALISGLLPIYWKLSVTIIEAKRQAPCFIYRVDLDQLTRHLKKGLVIHSVIYKPKTKLK